MRKRVSYYSQAAYTAGKVDMTELQFGSEIRRLERRITLLRAQARGRVVTRLVRVRGHHRPAVYVKPHDRRIASIGRREVV